MIVKAFVRLREFLTSQKEIAKKIHLLESRLDTHDAEIQSIIEAIRELIRQPEPQRRQIGFRVAERKTLYRVRSGHMR